MGEQRPQGDLAMIRRMMEDSRRLIHETGRHYIVWGVLIVIVPGVVLYRRARSEAAGAA